MRPDPGRTPGPGHALPPEPPAGRTFKDEPLTRLDLVARGADLAMRKRYLTSAWLGWRTVGHPSRACREYRNLARLRALGVPCLEALSWSEERGPFSQVRSCTLWTRYLPGASDLRTFFREQSRSEPGSRRRRRAVARELGRVLRLLHEAGALHLRAASRNFLATVAADPPAVLLCDVPYTVFSSASLAGGWWAGLDLYDALFSHHRRREMSASERLCALRAYTGGDRGQCRRFWRGLGRRSYAWNRFLKGLAIVVFKSILGLRAGARSGKLLDRREEAGGSPW